MRIAFYRADCRDGPARRRIELYDYNINVLPSEWLVDYWSKVFHLSIKFKNTSKEFHLLISSLVCHTGGYVSRITVRYCRFKSLPVSEHRLLPTITPSGFNMGMSLNMNFSRSSLAWAESPVRKSRKPFIIHEDGVSPGWTRLVITMAFFLCKENIYIVLFILSAKTLGKGFWRLNLNN